MKTVNQAFDKLLQELELTEQQRQAASNQQNRVREQVRRLPCYQADFLTGSYKRRTAIRPLKDIDFFVVVNEPTGGRYGHPIVEPAVMLGRLRGVLSTAWPTKDKPRRQTRSINVQFTGTGIAFDAVPAVPRPGSGYWIPDRDLRGWIASNPEQHEQHLIRANAFAGGKLNALVKLLKRWRRTLKDNGQSMPFSAFHLEVLAGRFFHDAQQRRPFTRYAEGLAYLLDWLSNQITRPCPEPAGLGPDLMATDPLLAQRLLQTAAQTAKTALDLECQNNLEAAHQHWRSLFGNDYSFRT